MKLSQYKVHYVGGYQYVYAGSKFEAYVQFNAKWPDLLITDVELV